MKTQSSQNYTYFSFNVKYWYYAVDKQLENTNFHYLQAWWPNAAKIKFK